MKHEIPKIRRGKMFNFEIMGYNRESNMKILPRIGVFSLKKVMDPVTEAERIVEDYVRALRGEPEKPIRHSSALPAFLVIFGMLALLGGSMAFFIRHGG